MPTIGRGRVTAGTGEVTFRPGDEAASEQDGLLPSGTGNEPSLSDVAATQSIYVRSITGNNLGSGAVIFRGSNGQLDVVLDFKTLVAGDGIEFEDSANELRISSTGGGTGGLPDIPELVPGSYDYASILVDQKGRIRFARSNVAGDVSNAQNLGFGSPLYVNKQVGVLRFRSLRGDVGSGVTTSVVGDEVVIGVTGVVRNLAVVPSNGITITGSPVTGSGTLVVGLADTTVVPGTYSAANIVVDRFGRITTASNGSINARLTVAQNGVVVGNFERLDIVGAAVTEPVSGTARISITTPTLNGLANRAGSGATVFAGVNAGVGEFRRITGSGIATVVEAADEIRITVPAPPAPTITDLENLAAGQGQVFDAITGGVGGFRRITGVGGIAVTTSGTDVIVDGSGVQPPASRVGVASDSGLFGSYSTLLVRGNATINNVPPGPTNTGTVAIEVPFGIGSVSNLGTSGPNIGFVYEGVSGTGQQTARFRRLIATDGLALSQNATDLVLSGAAFLTAVPASGVTPGTYNLANLVVGADGRILSASNGTAVAGVTSVSLAGPEFNITGSPITSAGTIGLALANSGVTAGTYSLVTVDAKGRVTAGAQANFVSSVALTGAGGIVASGGPITTSGTFSLDLATTGVAAGTYSFANIVVDTRGRLSFAQSGVPVTSVSLAAGAGVTVTTTPVTSTGTLTVGLAPSGVTAGTYALSNIVVDQFGRVLGASNGSASGNGITSLAVTGAGEIAVAGSPLTSAGTIGLSLAPSGVTAGTYSLVSVDSKGRVVAGSSASFVSSVAIVAGAGVAVSGGPITSTGTLTVGLANTGVSAGTYSLATVTVDPQGRVTSASAGTAVTSVALAAGGGVTLAGGPITTSGTITVGLSTLAASGTYSLANIVVDQFGRVTSASNGSASGNGITSLALSGTEFSFSPAELTNAGTISIALAPSGVAAGTFNRVTVDSKGRVTAGSNIPYLQTAVTSVAIAAGAGITTSGGPVTGVGTFNVALATSGVTAGSYALANITVDEFGRITSASSGSATGNGITSLTLSGADFTFAGSPLSSAGTIDFGLSPVGTPGTYTSVVTDAKGRVVSGTNPGFITGNQTITLSGDATGSGSTAIALTLANTGVAAGTYTRVAVDAKGRVTAGDQITFVSSVALAAGTGVVVSGGPITTTGTLTVGLANSGASAGTYSFSQIVVDAFGRVTSATSGVIPNQSVAFSGDATGTGTTGGTIALTLANTSVVPGSYVFSTITVDGKGRVTAAANGNTAVVFTGDASGGGFLGSNLTITLGSFGAVGTYNQIVTDSKGRVASGTLVPYLTANQTITLSGDATGSGSTAISVVLANTGVSAGTYSSVVVDAKGRVTAGTNPGFLTAESDTLASVAARGATTTATLTVGGIIGNASTATALQTSRVVAMSGDATGSANFDGSANATIPVTLANSGVTAGTYSFATVAVDAKGRVTFAAAGSPGGGPSLTTGTYDVARVTVDGNGQISAVAATTVANRGSAAPIMVQSAGTLAFKTIRAGSNVTVTESANEVTIGATGGGGGGGVTAYSWRVSLNASGVISPADASAFSNLPSGWTVSGVTGTGFVITSNVIGQFLPPNFPHMVLASPQSGGGWRMMSMQTSTGTNVRISSDGTSLTFANLSTTNTGVTDTSGTGFMWFRLLI